MSYEKVFGTPGRRPASYWRPWLGDHCSLSSSDLADLTPGQMLDAYRYVKRDD